MVQSWRKKTYDSLYNYFTVSPENSHTAILEDVDSLLFKLHDEVTVKWTPDSIIKSNIETNFRVNVEIYALQYRRATSNYFELEKVQVGKNIENDGQEKITLQHKSPLLFFSRQQCKI